MKKQSNFPTSDLFTTLHIYGQQITLPIGRLYSFSVHRVGSEVCIKSSYQGEQIGCYVVNLPNGL